MSERMITWTPERLATLRRYYAAAVEIGAKEFTIPADELDGQAAEFDTGYAKYLIEYLVMRGLK